MINIGWFFGSVCVCTHACACACAHRHIRTNRVQCQLLSSVGPHFIYLFICIVWQRSWGFVDSGPLLRVSSLYYVDSVFPTCWFHEREPSGFVVRRLSLLTILLASTLFWFSERLIFICAEARKGVRFLGVGVTDGCELPNMGAEKHIQGLWKSNKYF